MTFLKRKRKIRGLKFNLAAIPIDPITRAIFGMPNASTDFSFTIYGTDSGMVVLIYVNQEGNR